MCLNIHFVCCTVFCFCMYVFIYIYIYIGIEMNVWSSGMHLFAHEHI